MDIDVSDEDLFEGYILFSPWLSKKIYLMDNHGEIVNQWRSRHIRAGPVYLLENGNLLRAGSSSYVPLKFFFTGGCSGKIEMFNWAGDLIWSFKYVDNKYCLHNDIEPLPNGNVLMLVWDYKTHSEAINAGMDPNALAPFGPVMIDRIIEVEPIYPIGGNIVWEWSAWDHLIQDYNPTKDNYGNVSEHPELIDFNSKGRTIYNFRNTPVSLEASDFTHFNSIDYNEELDQILICSRHLNEVFIIDHSTTTKEAKGYTGGRSGRGGGLLYRWGNPLNYRRGNKSDQQFFSIHDARWIEPGCPGEGNITIFDNGFAREDVKYSSVIEFTPSPTDENGAYYLEDNSSYDPDKPSWVYMAENPTDFYSHMMSGAQRLSNGNTLICSGVEVRFFVVTPDKEIVWEYYNKLPVPFFGINYVFKTQMYSADYPSLEKLNIE